MYYSRHLLVGCVVTYLTLVGGLGCGPDESGGQRNVDTTPADPNIEELEAESQPLQPGGKTSLTVTANHSDGESLSYTWSLNDSNWSIEANGTTATLTAPDAYGAEVTVSVDVQAGEDASVQQSITLSTVANQLPQVTSLSASPNPIRPGETTTLQAQASDGNGDELSYLWTAPEGWSLGSNSGQTAELTAPDRENASAKVTLTVDDGFGGTTTEDVTITTRPNEAPRVESLAADPPQVEPGGTSTITLEASDPDGDELSYSWSGPDNWTVNGEGAEVEVTAPDAFGEEARVRVTVGDGRTETRGSVELSTPDNSGPVIQSLDAVPKTVEKGGTIDLSISASDPDGDTLSYNWSVAGSDWSLQSNNGTAATLQAPAQPGVRTNVSVTVTDSQNNTSSASILVSTQSNRAPTLTSLETNPPRVEPSGTITIQARASDPDDDALNYDWSPPNSDWSISTPSKGVAELTAPNTYGASGTVSVTISDGFGGEASGTTTVATVDNGAPIITNLQANPSQVAPAGTSTLRASARDPNGDSLSYSWTIPQGWSQQSESGSSLTLEGPDQYGVTGTVELVVEDGSGGSDRATVQVSTEGNLPPTLSSLTATPTVVSPGGTISVSADASDPNGDNLSYSWNVPSNWTQSQNGDSIQLQAPDQYGVTGTVELVVEDGSGGSDRATVQVSTEANSAPRITSLTATPTVVAPGGTSSLEVIASDANGDSLSYSWTVPQGWTETISGPKDTIEVEAPDQKSQSARIRVEVSDGNGGRTTAAVVVRTRLNQPPVIDSLTADPDADVEPGDTIQVDASTRDPDGSNSALTYNWTLPQGWQGSSSSDSIEVTAGRSYGQTSDITLEVDDGTDTTTQSVGVTMVDNQDPTIQSVDAGSSLVRLGESTQITVQASDPLGDSISYNWSLGNNNWSLAGSGDSVQVTAPNQRSETTLTVTVSDGFGGTVSTDITIQARRALYSFSAHTFTNCGQTGRQGPTLSTCRSAYNPSWADNSSYYDMGTRGYQKWTVPADGTYRLRVAGAQGGGGGGRGAIVAADVQLQRGETLIIVVGQEGNEVDNQWGHGGGGTFVARGADRSQADPLLVAGGGGGDREGTSIDASTSTDGVDGESGGGAGGSNGNGGDDGGSRAGAGGGGFYTDGNGYRSGEGGASFRNSASGGDSNRRSCVGGFGGGGSCNDQDETGGGGGYSGGGGASTNGQETGGGGGSFIASSVSNAATSNGSFQDNSSRDQGYSGSVSDLNSYNTGHGYVQITKK